MTAQALLTVVPFDKRRDAGKGSVLSGSPSGGSRPPSAIFSTGASVRYAVRFPWAGLSCGFDERRRYRRDPRPKERGRSSFESGLRRLLGTHRIESTGEVQEVEVSGTLAYCWTELTVRMVPRSSGNPTTRAGSALSILRKQASGSWVVVRDANMLAAAS